MSYDIYCFPIDGGVGLGAVDHGEGDEPIVMEGDDPTVTHNFGFPSGIIR